MVQVHGKWPAACSPLNAVQAAAPGLSADLPPCIPQAVRHVLEGRQEAELELEPGAAGAGSPGVGDVCGSTAVGSCIPTCTECMPLRQREQRAASTAQGQGRQPSDHEL